MSGNISLSFVLTYVSVGFLTHINISMGLRCDYFSGDYSNVWNAGQDQTTFELIVKLQINGVFFFFRLDYIFKNIFFLMIVY